MSRVPGRNTRPEKSVHNVLDEAGIEYQLHCAHLPGRPDIAIPLSRVAIFVHGCFWHGHDCSKGRSMPKTNAEFWKAKIERNKQRDQESMRGLRELGWHVEVIWECEVRRRDLLAAKLISGGGLSSVESRA